MYKEVEETLMKVMEMTEHDDSLMADVITRADTMENRLLVDEGSFT